LRVARNVWLIYRFADHLAFDGPLHQNLDRLLDIAIGLLQRTQRRLGAVAGVRQEARRAQVVGVESGTLARSAC
jgi:hypothetical protein